MGRRVVDCTDQPDSLSNETHHISWLLLFGNLGKHVVERNLRQSVLMSKRPSTHVLGGVTGRGVHAQDPLVIAFF